MDMLNMAKISRSSSDINVSQSSLRPDNFNFRGSTQSLQIPPVSARVHQVQEDISSSFFLRRVSR
jgi:hypothetical protein